MLVYQRVIIGIPNFAHSQLKSPVFMQAIGHDSGAGLQSEWLHAGENTDRLVTFRH